MFGNDLLESRSSWRRKCQNRDPGRMDECRGRAGWNTCQEGVDVPCRNNSKHQRQVTALGALPFIASLEYQ